MANGGIVLLVGDAAYTVRSIHEELLPLITDDDERSRRSLSELRAFAEAEPDATLVPSHDPTAWHGLREEEEPLQAATGAR
jgi:glyoxylase-like metal-dependent hydrolase (beta-lactamase superfamily II)